MNESRSQRGCSEAPRYPLTHEEALRLYTSTFADKQAPRSMEGPGEHNPLQTSWRTTAYIHARGTVLNKPSVEEVQRVLHGGLKEEIQTSRQAVESEGGSPTLSQDAYTRPGTSASATPASPETPREMPPAMASSSQVSYGSADSSEGWVQVDSEESEVQAAFQPGHGTAAELQLADPSFVLKTDVTGEETDRLEGDEEKLTARQPNLEDQPIEELKSSISDQSGNLLGQAQGFAAPEGDIGEGTLISRQAQGTRQKIKGLKGLADGDVIDGLRLASEPKEYSQEDEKQKGLADDNVRERLSLARKPQEAPQKKKQQKKGGLAEDNLGGGHALVKQAPEYSQDDKQKRQLTEDDSGQLGPSMDRAANKFSKEDKKQKRPATSIQLSLPSAKEHQHQLRVVQKEIAKPKGRTPEQEHTPLLHSEGEQVQGPGQPVEITWPQLYEASPAEEPPPQVPPDWVGRTSSDSPEEKVYYNFETGQLAVKRHEHYTFQGPDEEEAHPSDAGAPLAAGLPDPQTHLSQPGAETPPLNKDLASHIAHDRGLEPVDNPDDNNANSNNGPKVLTYIAGGILFIVGAVFVVGWVGGRVVSRARHLLHASRRRKAFVHGKKNGGSVDAAMAALQGGLDYMGESSLEEEEDMYTVKEGDTMWCLSRRLLKNPKKWPYLYEASRDEIGPDPRELKPGTNLRKYVKKAQELAEADSKRVNVRAQKVFANEPISSGTGVYFGQAPEKVEQPPMVIVETRVKEDDSLWTISEDFFGDGRLWPRLVQRNPGAFLNEEEASFGYDGIYMPYKHRDDPTMVKPGDILTVAIPFPVPQPY